MMSADILQHSIKRTFGTDSSNHLAIKRRENAEVFLEVGGDLVQGGECRLFLSASRREKYLRF